MLCVNLKNVKKTSNDTTAVTAIKGHRQQIFHRIFPYFSLDYLPVVTDARHFLQQFLVKNDGLQGNIRP